MLVFEHLRTRLLGSWISDHSGADRAVRDRAQHQRPRETAIWPLVRWNRNDSKPSRPTWVACYDAVKVEKPFAKAHSAAWAALLFPDAAKSVRRPEFDARLPEGLALAARDALWAMLATSATAPVLYRAEVPVRLAVLSESDARATLDRPNFGAAMRAASLALSDAPTIEVIDYESLDISALRALCAERGILKPPPSTRFICEELRFYDEHGRPAVRNKRTRQLE